MKWDLFICLFITFANQRHQDGENTVHIIHSNKKN